jgi:hypothetical protein
MLCPRHCLFGTRWWRPLRVEARNRLAPGLLTNPASAFLLPAAISGHANYQVLIERLRELVPPGLVEKNVFGARCWVHEGHMAFGVQEDDMLVRLGSDFDSGATAASLTPFDPMDTGKPMAGLYLVGEDDVAEEAELQEWMDTACAFTANLPPK